MSGEIELDERSVFAGAEAETAAAEGGGGGGGGEEILKEDKAFNKGGKVNTDCNEGILPSLFEVGRGRGRMAPLRKAAATMAGLIVRVVGEAGPETAGTDVDGEEEGLAAPEEDADDDDNRLVEDDEG